MTDTNTTHAVHEGHAGPGRSQRTARAALLSGTFVAALDAAIANVAAPEIQADLGASGTALVLALSGYPWPTRCC